MASEFQKLTDFSEVDERQSTTIMVDDHEQARSPRMTHHPQWLDRFNWLNDKRKVLLRAVLGEGLCTFLFMFIVCATHVNHVRTQTEEQLVLAAISTGFASIALIYSFADVSGAHFNPAVTFATLVTGKVSIGKAALFMGVQLLAATFASAFVCTVFPKTADGQSTLNLLFVDIGAESDPGRAFVMEFLLTFILVYVIFATAFDTVDSTNAITVANVDDNERRPQRDRAAAARNLTIYTASGNTKAGFAPIAIGMTLGFLCLVGGTVSGGAFNPARVFGPALIGNNWSNNWVYWFGDLLGAAAAGFAQSFFAHKPVQHSGGAHPSPAAAH
ncbi:hypothetical protein RI367_003218 [Sorochytrium milnesiophthora]